ncbi:hypothetical protein H257_06700 [Aphanomyces astaci]|uniref:Uncharacterized protein n=1 Tax=Aphanomyces astaci TaxID=112090 RepID=W4GLZ5_APHAT|nr:hypothetical protein H257_06700 [Aphanomyces astaci]ETV80391.1 hypothetical protein H257_06700 [Aphanomyces astaci]|eukprot:XP_009830315.1 hypothetical protein H257_06700 [Aphanomyces astaci]
MNSKRRVATAMPQEKPQQQRVLERQARDQRLERLNVVPSGHTTPWNSNTNVQSTRVARPLVAPLVHTATGTPLRMSRRSRRLVSFDLGKSLPRLPQVQAEVVPLSTAFICTRGTPSIGLPTRGH